MKAKLEKKAASDLAFVDAKTVKQFILHELCEVLFQILYLIFFLFKLTLFHKILFNFLG